MNFIFVFYWKKWDVRVEIVIFVVVNFSENSLLYYYTVFIDNSFKGC